MKSYNTYIRKLYYISNPNLGISFQEWVEVFEAIILKMEEFCKPEKDINRTVKGMLQAIAKGHLDIEEYKFQMVEGFPWLNSKDFLEDIIKGDGKTSLENLYKFLKLKLLTNNS